MSFFTKTLCFPNTNLYRKFLSYIFLSFFWLLSDGQILNPSNYKYSCKKHFGYFSDGLEWRSGTTTSKNYTYNGLAISIILKIFILINSLFNSLSYMRCNTTKFKNYPGKILEMSLLLERSFLLNLLFN